VTDSDVAPREQMAAGELPDNNAVHSHVAMTSDMEVAGEGSGGRIVSVTTCPNCGAFNPAGFCCRVCGTSLPSIVQEESASSGVGCNAFVYAVFLSLVSFVGILAAPNVWTLCAVILNLVLAWSRDDERRVLILVLQGLLLLISIVRFCGNPWLGTLVPVALGGTMILGGVLQNRVLMREC
jgi:hypothetical protein